MTTQSPLPSGDRAGFTLVEVIATLMLMAVLLSLAAPVMRRMLDTHRAQSASAQLANDLAFTRSLAVQNGRAASLSRTGATTYVITVDTSTTSTALSEQKTVRTRNLANEAIGLTLGPANLRVTFDSRGFVRAGTGAITLTRRDGQVQTLNVEALGRIDRAN